MTSDKLAGGTSRSRQRKLNKRMDDLFPQEQPDLCRVCNEPVVDGRWNYCSERCRDIAQSVQKMFTWDAVREKILERDDYTCQECGLTQEMQKRAYWQVREIVDERADNLDGRVDLWEQYGDLEHRVMEVDHIKRVADGGHPFDESNLRTLCEYCHSEKTASENSSREPAPDVTLQDYIES